MVGPRIVPPQASAAQTRSSDPATSVFVSANAGSGKTHVLVQRVVRLLLAGVPPAKILCITFTKAAAANMAQRVFAKLGEWVALDDVKLDAALRDNGIANPTARTRAQARKLFATALETPGGLKVQTIHALCTRLLQQFPFEANVPAHFAVLDDRDQTEMMERARLQVLLDAAQAPDSAGGRALRTAMASAADVTFRDVVNEAVLSRDHLLAWIARAGGIDAATSELSRALGIGSGTSLEAIEQDIVDGPHLPIGQWDALAAELDRGSKTDNEQAGRLRDALASSGSLRCDAYLSVFLTEKMELRKSIITKKISDARPGIAAAFEREKQRIGGLLELRRAAVMRDRTEALLVIASSVAENYRREKHARGAMDYADLIEKTLDLLERTSSGWVHYKLDRGIDHVLIDEAQDTSPKQWDIVEKLIAEFASGEGAREVKRTIFAVGDEKQSIFSFQGAIPKEFDSRRRKLATTFSNADLSFETIKLQFSFRSGSTILNSVDAVFRDPDKYKSIHAVENNSPLHEALPDAAPSLIELWELEQPPPREDMEGWRAPFDAVSQTSPEVTLANRIQRKIKSLVDRRELTGASDKRRPLSYGDMLVLVRRRGKAFDAVIQALKHAGIPVAGADRLKLTEHIAVIDLMSLGDALLLPQDDLALAVALKSPLFSLDEDALFALAWHREGSLRAALASKSASDSVLATAWTRLRTCAARAASETPFSFYAWLLGADGGRERIMRRLGPEANDAIDEFLELALAYERRAPASLQGFLAWLRASDTEVKRDMEIARDEVRVMTVHGAKGLEAPVVFLADTTSTPVETQRLHLVHLPQDALPDASSITVWAGKKADDPAPVVQARASMQEDTNDEYRRLLYVAMTRAADQLIIGGCKPGNRKDILPSSWYALVRDGLAQSSLHQEAIETPDGPVLRFSRAEDVSTPQAQKPEQLGLELFEFPKWLRTRAPEPKLTSIPVRPSGPSETAGLRSQGSPRDQQRALQRGTLVHRLLQSLPEIPHASRHDAASRFLARNATDWSDAERNDLIAQILMLIDDARFTHVFAAEGRAEVPIIGRLERPGRPDALVSGQIDRLLVTPDVVWIVDYKTNHAPPRAAAEAPPGYVRQLALYRGVLALLYPDRPIRAALLWTETPEIMEIPAPVLDRELAQVISS